MKTQIKLSSTQFEEYIKAMVSLPRRNWESIEFNGKPLYDIENMYNFESVVFDRNEIL